MGLEQIEVRNFCSEAGETVEQVAQGGGGCPIPGNIQVQIRRGPEQLDLIEDAPAHCRRTG